MRRLSGFLRMVHCASRYPNAVMFKERSELANFLISFYPMITGFQDSDWTCTGCHQSWKVSDSPRHADFCAATRIEKFLARFPQKTA